MGSHVTRTYVGNPLGTGCIWIYIYVYQNNQGCFQSDTVGVVGVVIVMFNLVFVDGVH